jgi:hypothetical protein
VAGNVSLPIILDVKAIFSLRQCQLTE